MVCFNDNFLFFAVYHTILCIYGLPVDSDIKADLLLLTHCRRDLLWAAKQLIEKGTVTYASAEDYKYFTKIDSFWIDFIHTRFGDYEQQTTKYPVTSLAVDRKLKDGDVIKWQELEFRVINTPGYTRGAISYVSDIDDQKVIFSGDLIYGDGKLFDLYSLQDKVDELNIMGYHGFAGRISELISSLQKIKNFKPDMIVPARGPVIYEPELAINNLIKMLQNLYANYLSTSAYRWYTGNEKQKKLAERAQLDSSAIDWMPMAKLRKQSPAWLKHELNSVVITSKKGSAFLIDCGIDMAWQRLFGTNGILSDKKIEGVFITHYHDDHTNFISPIIDKHNCPVFVTKDLADILSHPEAYRMPAMTTKGIPNISVVPDGHKMHWNEFQFTFYNFPGQTIYHNAMLVEFENEKIFLIGDSFSPTGMDDYCLLNRNIIHRGFGYFYCLNILRSLPDDTWLVNQHIQELFQFSKENLDFMDKKLEEREILLSDLNPWEDINYLIDEQWARIFPYSSEIQKGENTCFAVKVFNHQNELCKYRITPNVNASGFTVSPPYIDLSVASLQEGEAKFTLYAKEQQDKRVQLVTADIQYNDRNLHEWCEGIIVIK
jgi:glyoxylase-like metal-dependent hydrolase (beta-lactamase superfamily II)